MGQHCLVEVTQVKQLTGIGVGRELAAPLHKGVALVLARRDGIGADGADDAGVAEGRLRGDDRVGDVVVDALC